MSAVKKPVLSPVELALQEVAHACIADPLRPRMTTPFGYNLFGQGVIAATDGHRLAVVKSDDWRPHARGDAPKIDNVLSPARGQLTCLGEIGMNLEPARAIPSNWPAIVSFHNGMSLLSAVQYKGKKQKERRVAILENVAVPWLRHSLALGGESVAFQLGYLYDAFAFLGVECAYVHAELSKGKIEQWAPFYFTASSRAPLECERFTVVMSFRQA